MNRIRPDVDKLENDRSSTCNSYSRNFVGRRGRRRRRRTRRRRTRIRRRNEEGRYDS